MPSVYPVVLSEETTIAYLKTGMSIARYGDGEFKLCRGAGIKCQVYDPVLSVRLREILGSRLEQCIVGIPRIADPRVLNPEKRAFWSGFNKPQYIRMMLPDKVYGSAFISRPDSIPAINTKEYFESVKALWQDRRVILINGDNRPFEKDPSIVSNAKSFVKWLYPSQNAWDEYRSLLGRCSREPKDILFLLALGPTATVLAHDLCGLGYQALDIGHLGMFYARLRREQ